MDSDTELELALPAVDRRSPSEEIVSAAVRAEKDVPVSQAGPELATEAETAISSSIPNLAHDGETAIAIPSAIPVSAQAASAAPAAPAAPTFTTFQQPPNPSIPQDLSLIMEMVASQQVVGSLPPIHMSAAEKRRLVEESIKAKGKGKPEQPKPEESSDEDSSSENESSSEEESSDEDEKEPMTVERHEELKAELDGLIGKQPDVDDQDDGEDEGAFEFSDSPLPSPHLETIDLEMFEDEEGGGTAEPILSANEVALPPVALPPIEKLPEGEKTTLAGEVVSWMREKRVEAWLEEREKQTEKEGEITEAKHQGAAPDDEAVSTKEAQDGQGISTTQNIPTPKFNSSGTIVIRAMQSRPGANDEGWLEEGSVVCWKDGRVLGTVSETFGPLTSPFYSLRLPPPPYPYPSPELTQGTQLFYPLNPIYRSFVNMRAVHDPRFKGSDASNRYDEEIGEEEQEWSDDEAEAEAKRRRKNKRGNPKTPSIMGTPRGGSHGLPKRPHFDYAPDDDTGSVHGGGDDDLRSEYSYSDAGSSSGRPMPAPYDIDDDISGMAGPSRGRGGGGSRGGRGQGRGGRGQGRTRGGGRRNDSGKPPQHQQQQQQSRSSSSLPPRPQPVQSWQPSSPHNQPPHQFQSNNQNQFQQYPPPQLYQQYQQYPPHPQQSYNPQSQPQPYGQHQPFSQPSFNIPPSFVPQDSYHPQQHQQPQQDFQPFPSVPTSPGGVAINPRFAAQYQQMYMSGQNQSQGGYQNWNDGNQGQ